MGGRRDEIRSRHTKYRHSDINAALVEVRQLLSASASSSGGFTEWHDAYFEEINLNPSGKALAAPNPELLLSRQNTYGIGQS